METRWKKYGTDFPVLMPPDALVYCSSNWEEDPKGRVSSAYESDIVRVVNSTESEMTLVAGAWSRRASDQRIGVRNGRTLGCASVRIRRRQRDRLVIGGIRLLSYDRRK